MRALIVKFFDMLKDIMPFALISVAVMVGVWFITEAINNVYLLLVARVLLAALLYVVIMKLLKVQMMKECLEFLKVKRLKG